jgi:hypothetical protein
MRLLVEVRLPDWDCGVEQAAVRQAKMFNSEGLHCSLAQRPEQKRAAHRNTAHLSLIALQHDVTTVKSEPVP